MKGERAHQLTRDTPEAGLHDCSRLGAIARPVHGSAFSLESESFIEFHAV